MGGCTLLGLHGFVCVVTTLVRGSHGKLYTLRSSCLCVVTTLVRGTHGKLYTLRSSWLCLCSDYIGKGLSWDVVHS